MHYGIYKVAGNLTRARACGTVWSSTKITVLFSVFTTFIYRGKGKVVDMTEQSNVPKAVSVFKLVGCTLLLHACNENQKNDH